MTSKSPLATVRLWKKTAFKTIQLIGHRPNAMPSVAVANVMPKGMPQTAQESNAAVSIAARAHSQAGRRRMASMTKRTESGSPATRADSRMLPSTGWYCWWNAKSVPIVPPSKATERFVNSNRIGRRLQPARYQLPPPPPPPPPPQPPPEPPPPPNPLQLPPLGVDDVA